MPVRLSLICAPLAGVRGAVVFPGGPANAPEVAAAATAPRFPPLGRCDRVWVSPAPEAQQLAVAMGVAAVVEEELRECDFGRWSGHRLADIQAREPDALAAWITDPAAAPHGGESVLDLLARTARWLDARADETGHAVAIAHSGLIRALIVHALAAPPPSFWRVDVLPLSLTDLRCHQRRWRLRLAAGNS